MHIGPYAIGTPIDDYPTVYKLSWWNTYDIKRPKVRGLKLYKSKECIDFLHSPCEVILGVVHGSVWALSVFLAFKTENLMADKLIEFVDYYRHNLGENTSDQQYPIKWITSFGLITISVGSVIAIETKMYYFTLTVSAK
jgi:hypothetical protein